MYVFFRTVTAFGFGVLPQTAYFFVSKIVMNLNNYLQFEIKTYVPTYLSQILFLELRAFYPGVMNVILLLRVYNCICQESLVSAIQQY